MYSNIIGQNNEGEGITKINGIITFVPFALKGDIVNLNIIKKIKNIIMQITQMYYKKV